jgi:hypothetical protein
MTRTVATAIVAAVAVAGVLAQPGTPPLTHEYAEVNGMRLHYAKAGSGPLMVFLHGFPEFWYEWKNQLAEFSRDHTVVAPDLRGYNLSSKPADVSAYQIPNLVEDARADGRAHEGERRQQVHARRSRLGRRRRVGVCRVASRHAGQAGHPQRRIRRSSVESCSRTRTAEGQRVHADVPERGSEALLSEDSYAG